MTVVRRVLAWGTTVLLAASSAGTVGAGPARGADHPAAPPDDVSLDLEAQPFVISAGDDWRATFRAEGGITIPPPPPTTASSTVTPTAAPRPSARPVVEARVLAHPPVADPLDIAEALEQDVDITLSRRTVPIASTADGSSFTIDVPTTTDLGDDDGEALLLSRPGVYPVTVELVFDGEIVASHRTFVHRLPAEPDEDAMPVDVAVVAAVEDPGPDPDSAALAAARAAVGDIADSARALGGRMSVRLPPTVVEELPPSALAEVADALRRVELLSAPRLALDPSAAVAADQQDAFSVELRAGEDLLGTALPDTPPLRSAWLTGSSRLSAAAGSMLREPLGFDLVVFDQEVYNELEGGIGGFHDPSLAFGVQLGDATLPGFVVSPLSRWLDREELERHGMSAIDGAVTLLAELLVWRDAHGADLRRSVVLELPDGSAPEPDVLAALAALIETTPGVALTTLSALPASTDVMEVPDAGPETVTLPADAGLDLSARVERINLVRLHAAGAGSMLVDQSRAAAWDADLDELLSTALDDETVDARLERISAEAQEVFERVETPPPSTLTLTGRTSTLRWNLTNTGDEDLRVVVHPSSPKLTFPNGDVPLTLAANDVTEVVIEVEARANGTSAIGLEVVTPVGSLNVDGPVVLTARVNALSGLGQVVTGGALLVLLSWWYGHFRRRRRRRRALLGEVDNPRPADHAVSPDAAEATVHAPASDSVSEP